MRAGRALDLILVIVAAPVLLPLGLVIALMVMLDSPGPVFYRCRRIGTGGEPFEMLKFRKMLRDATGGPLTSQRDDRFTPIGRFLTLTRLDELPQVWNILRGEMRVVGPRPETEAFVACYPDQYREILQVTPGLTGLAQLRFAGESHLLEGVEDREQRYREHILPAKLNLDLAYVRSHSFGMDLRILFGTALLPFVALGHLIRRAVLRVSPGRLGMAVTIAFVAATIVGTFSAQA